MSPFLRVAILLMMTWFALDMSTPSIPGAFQFSADQSVEVVRAPGQLIVGPVQRDAPVTGGITLSVREKAAIRPRSSTLRPMRRTRARRQDPDRGSSARQFDPA
jgi:hypothetical protein